MKIKTLYILSLLLLVFNFTKVNAQAVKETSQKKKQQEHRQKFTNSTPQAIGFVNDYEHNFNQKQIATLDHLITNFRNETSIQIAIITVDTSMISKDKFSNFIFRTANAWGVGEKGKDNGILIGFSRTHRLIRIENGYGIEKLISDKETKGIIDHYFTPSFKKDDYYTGTLTGLTELIKLLKTKIKD